MQSVGSVAAQTEDENRRLRVEVSEAAERCKQAGVSVRHPAVSSTASALAARRV
jgi:hypothetical protein